MKHMTERKRSRFQAYPCRLNTRIQAWTLGPRTQRHLRVVREVSSTARENVSKADLKHTREIRGSRYLCCTYKHTSTAHEHHQLLTQSAELRREPPQRGRTGTTGRSTDRSETTWRAAERNGRRKLR